MKRVLLLLALVTLIAPAARADLTVQSEVDRAQIDMNSQITLTVTVKGDDNNIGTPQLPPIPDFVTTGTGSRENLLIQNGLISRSRTYTYSLIPRKAGKLTIGPVTVTSDARTVKTAPITVTVTASALSPQTRRNVPSTNSGRTERRTNSKPFFVEAEIDKDTVYLGEQVTYTFSYYRNVALTESNTYSPPQTTGFISVPLPPNRRRTTVIDGESYNVVQVVSAMFPTRTGELTIGPARLRVVPDVFSNLLGRDPFGWFGRSGSRLTSGEPRNLATRSKEVFVKPLPRPPAGLVFSGAVGKCALGASISADSVGVGDPVTITWTLSGKGRMDLVDPPRVDWPNGLETYPPTTDLATSTDRDIVAETKTFSVAVVPRKQGTITIPAPEVTYFDPADTRYKVARARALTLRVGPPRAGITTAAPTQTISASASTIRYLKPSPTQFTRHETERTEIWFVLLHLLPPLFIGVLYAWRRHTEAPEQRARGARQKAVKSARARLAAARKISSADTLAQEISAAFRDYLAARFGLSTGELIDSSWADRLHQSGCANDDVQLADKVMNWTNRARFGGGAADPDISPDAVLKLMERLDKCVS